MTSERTALKQRGRPFPRGRSGNPHGRPVGAKNKMTLAAEALLNGEAQQLTRKAVALALKGNVACLRLCLERLVPPRRDRLVRFTISTMNSAGDACKAMAAIATAVAAGELTPNEAAGISNVVAAYVRAVEATDIERRLRLLEEAQGDAQ